MEKPMPHVDLLELPYFQGISIHELVALVDQMKPRDFSEGQDLIVNDAPPPPPAPTPSPPMLDTPPWPSPPPLGQLAMPHKEKK